MLQQNWYRIGVETYAVVNPTVVTGRRCCSQPCVAADVATDLRHRPHMRFIVA
jgi:hypothetical protein